MRKTGVIWLFAILILVSCSAFIPPEIPPDAVPSMLSNWNSSTFWTQPIAVSPLIDINSDTYIQKLVTEHSRPTGSQTKYELLILTEGGTVPVYLAGSTDRRISIPISTAGYGAAGLQGVPFPAWVESDRASDGHAVIVDTVNSLVFEFWQLRRLPYRWQCSASAILDLTSAGVHEGKFSVTASGFSLLSGLIWPSEIESGNITHALVFGYPLTKKKTFVSPATRSDGWSDDPAALPMGAHLQLDPGLDLNSLDPPLNAIEKIVAKALQDYGMYLYDTGSAGSIIELDAVSRISFPKDPYQMVERYAIQDGYIDIGNIPLEYLRVLKLPELQTWGTSYPQTITHSEYYYE